ncbi:MAG: hypothetical protein WCI95_11585 [bacterium]
MGPKFSQGDKYIYDCATGTAGTGNLTTWRKVGTNHHLAALNHTASSGSAIPTSRNASPRSTQEGHSPQGVAPPR